LCTLESSVRQVGTTSQAEKNLHEGKERIIIATQHRLRSRADVSSVAYFKIHPTISQLYLRRARNTIGIARISVARAAAADEIDPAKDTLTRDDYAISPRAIKGAGGLVAGVSANRFDRGEII